MSGFRRRLMMMQGGGGQIPSEDGVYIQSIDGKFYTYDEWNLPNEQANGVAVISSEHPDGGFVIAKVDSGGAKSWGSSNKTISGIITTTSSSTAKKDYAGDSNTTQIISQDGSNSQAASYCRGYTFPNGMNGYLGSLGEWDIAYKNKASITRCMSKIGGKTFYESNYHWSSTQHSSSKAWLFNWESGNVNNYGKDYALFYYARAFAAL